MLSVGTTAEVKASSHLRPNFVAEWGGAEGHWNLLATKGTSSITTGKSKHDEYAEHYRVEMW